MNTRKGTLPSQAAHPGPAGTGLAFLCCLLLALALFASRPAPVLALDAAQDIVQDAGRNIVSPAACVSMADIEASLPNAPIVAGFDIDDTLLFSSPAFYYGAANREGPDGTGVYGPEPYKSQSFWDDMNSRLVQFCPPLETGRKLVEMHKRRGDAIVFITARRGSVNETLTEQLARLFGLTNVKPTVFTDGGAKSEAMRQLGVSIFYGDGDGDVKSALDAGVRPIRTPRPAISTAPDPIHPGAFGEQVLQTPWLPRVGCP